MKNIVFIEIDKGDDFGNADLIEASIEQEISIEDIIQGQGAAKRTFTVYALTNCELLALTLDIIFKMTKEFYHVFEAMFEDGELKLKRLRLQ